MIFFVLPFPSSYFFFLPSLQQNVMLFPRIVQSCLGFLALLSVRQDGKRCTDLFKFEVWRAWVGFPEVSFLQRVIYLMLSHRKVGPKKISVLKEKAISCPFEFYNTSLVFSAPEMCELRFSNSLVPLLSSSPGPPKCLIFPNIFCLTFSPSLAEKSRLVY